MLSQIARTRVEISAEFTPRSVVAYTAWTPRRVGSSWRDLRIAAAQAGRRQSARRATGPLRYGHRGPAAGDDVGKERCDETARAACCHGPGGGGDRAADGLSGRGHAAGHHVQLR